MEIVSAARKHLHPSFIPNNETLFQITTESLEPSFVHLPDLTLYGNQNSSNLSRQFYISVGKNLASCQLAFVKIDMEMELE